MTIQRGGCLCEAVRYETEGAPLRVTVCHCRFCQRATGSAYMVEPVFRSQDLRITAGVPSVYTLRSGGSGKLVHVHFCATCGTKLYLTFERFAQACGVYAGTFDDPDWFEIDPDTAKHIFLRAARPDTILPQDLPCFEAHAVTNAGEPLDAVILREPRPVGQVRESGRASDQG